MPVARNVWQQVDGGSPAVAARRLIMASTTRRVNDRSRQPIAHPVHALKQRFPPVLEPRGLGGKDTDENYLAVWQARETVENGLRLGAVGDHCP